MSSEAEDLRPAKERAWRELAEIDAAYDRGELDEVGWHAAVLAIVEPAYLSADSPRAQSGRSGDAASWRHARGLLLDALPGDCTLLDIGCANGHLMETLVAWAAEEAMKVEPYGVEISAPLAELARTRCPQWADRIWTANAMGWQPPRRFDVVRTGLEYVPPDRRAAYLSHLIRHVVAPGGRLVIGVYNEGRDGDVASEVRSYGHHIAGRTSRPHRHPRLAYKAFWIET